VDQISPDGAWRWTGTDWVPNTPPPATPPTASDGTTVDPAAAAVPDVAATFAAPVDEAPAPAAAVAPAATTDTVDTTPGAKVGDIVTVRLSDDEPAFTALVVGGVDGSTEAKTVNGEQQNVVLRDAGVLIVPLPDATFVPNSALRD